MIIIYIYIDIDIDTDRYRQIGREIKKKKCIFLITKLLKRRSITNFRYFQFFSMYIEGDLYLLYRLSSNTFISTHAFGINTEFSCYVDNNKFIFSCLSPNSSGIHNQESRRIFNCHYQVVPINDVIVFLTSVINFCGKKKLYLECYWKQN